MQSQTMTQPGATALLERLRTRRELPLPADRKRIREEAGCSIRELAAALDVSQMAVFRWEGGAQPRNPEHLQEYARLLDELRRLGP